MFANAHSLGLLAHEAVALVALDLTLRFVSCLLLVIKRRQGRELSSVTSIALGDT